MENDEREESDERLADDSWGSIPVADLTEATRGDEAREGMEESDEMEEREEREGGMADIDERGRVLKVVVVLGTGFPSFSPLKGINKLWNNKVNVKIIPGIRERRVETGASLLVTLSQTFLSKSIFPELNRV